MPTSLVTFEARVRALFEDEPGMLARVIAEQVGHDGRSRGAGGT